MKPTFLMLISTSIIALIYASAEYDECEVCTDLFTEVMKKVDESGEKGEPAVKKMIIEHCKSVKGVDDKKEKLCFFIGAHPDSATSVLGDIAKPLSFHKPPKKICSQLKEKDSQICALKYDKPIDWDSLVLEKMRVKQLKELLLKLGDSCKGCTEKVDYITRINELKPKPNGGEL
ncbi:hypothetical protein niasHS_001727 [Heterodera schachtii]|uniref:Mesencephalic astrocyte-derived neurotrophic factor homolog n=1 Tax=Heterodera schachtii TaxID=97005 RepID=A0ABD2KBX6_HETSC